MAAWGQKRGHLPQEYEAWGPAAAVWHLGQEGRKEGEGVRGQEARAVQAAGVAARLCMPSHGAVYNCLQ